MSASPVLEVADLSISFGALAAVSGVSFRAERGHITSVIGPNGAGKSTLFNLISGALRPQRGTVHFAGADVTGQSPNRLLLAGPCPAIDSEDPGNAGFTGSVIIAEFASLADAQAFADSDPYVAAGVYQNVIVKPFKKVLP